MEWGTQLNDLHWKAKIWSCVLAFWINGSQSLKVLRSFSIFRDCIMDEIPLIGVNLWLVWERKSKTIPRGV